MKAGLSLAGELAFPRLCGTEGERRAAEILQARFGEMGWQQAAQPVHVTNAIVLNLKAIALLCAATGAASWLPARLYLLWGAVAGVVGVAIVHDIWRWSAEGRAFGIAPRRVAETANLFFVMPPHEKPAIWLCAHYDSKGQMPPLAARMLLISALLGSLAISLAAALLCLWVPYGALAVLQRSFGVLAVGCALPLLLLRTTNESPGALDNAGSVGAVYALARAWQQNPEAMVAFGIVLTAGEEWGLAGGHAAARHLSANYAGQAKPLVINLEGVGGSEKFLWRLPPMKLQHEVRPYLLRLRTEQKGRRLPMLPGAAADHLAFWRHQVPAATLFAFGKKLRHIHTPADTSEKVDTDAFALAVQQLSAFLRKNSQTTVVQ